MCSTRKSGIKVTVNDLRFMEKRNLWWFLYQKKDSDKVEKQSTRRLKFLTETHPTPCNSVIAFLVAS